jgi:hypothetical protein
VLPEYLELKTEIAEYLNRYLQLRVAGHSGLMRVIPTVRFLEGGSHAMHHVDGKLSSKEFREFGAERSSPVAELEKMDFAGVLREVDVMAERLAREMATHAFQTMDEAAEATGNVVDSRGQPMTGAMLLQMLERLPLSFDADGPRLGLFITHPQQSAAAAAMLRSLEEDPELRMEYHRILEQKREQWRAREASRRLVG